MMNVKDIFCQNPMVVNLILRKSCIILRISRLDLSRNAQVSPAATIILTFSVIVVPIPTTDSKTWSSPKGLYFYREDWICRKEDSSEDFPPC